MFNHNKSTNLKFIQKIEFSLGIHRNFNELSRSKKKFVIMQILTILIINVYGIQSFIINHMNQDINPQMYIPLMLYVISQFFEACIVLASAIWFSSDYIELLKVFNNFNSVDKKKYPIVLLCGTIIFILSMLTSFAIKKVYIKNDLINILETYSMHYIMGSHLVQAALFASLYVAFGEITNSFVFYTLGEENDENIKHSKFVNINVPTMGSINLSQLWKSYDQLIQYCTLFNKIFGYQVRFFLIIYIFFN